MFLTDDTQVLAAVPSFDSDPPSGGGCEVRVVRRFSEHRSEPCEQQPENGLLPASGPAADGRLR